MTSVTGIFSAIVVGLCCRALDNALKQQSEGKLHWFVELLMSLPLVYVPVDCILLAEGRGTPEYLDLAIPGMIAMLVAFFIPRYLKQQGTLVAVGLAVFSTLVFGAMLICRPTPQGPTEPQLSIEVPDLVHQRQAVTVKAQPPLAPGQVVHIWVKGIDDIRWWPACDQAVRDRSLSTWTSTCKFGSPKFPAKEKGKFYIGAFFTADKIEDEPSLSDSVWKLLKTQQTVAVTFSTGR
jgi:hypothetical protein